MTAFLIDEMFPIAAAVLLRDTYGHDAVHVAEAGLRAAEDAHVASVARGEGRAVVTENVADFAAERDVVLVFVLKKNLPAGGGQAAALAKVLNRWAQEHPEPDLFHLAIDVAHRPCGHTEVGSPAAGAGFSGQRMARNFCLHNGPALIPSAIFRDVPHSRRGQRGAAGQEMITTAAPR